MGKREGEAVNRSCIVMMSAVCQSYVEEVFMECSSSVFGAGFEDIRDEYIKTFKRWGNPNPNNIRNLFKRIAVKDVFNGLKWQGRSQQQVTVMLDSLNQMRNDIAHGENVIKVDNEIFTPTLPRVRLYRDFLQVFGSKFHGHALSLVRNR